MLAILLSLLIEWPGAHAPSPRPPADPAGATVVINEIQYNSADAFDTEDWVEIVNPTDAAVDLSGWVLSDEEDIHRFALPAGTSLAPGGYLVLCADAALFAAAYPDAEPCLGDWDFGLSGGGDQVRLFDADDMLVDMVEYDDNAPWPAEADGEGSTLELLDPTLDNTVVESWRASTAFGGTPGAMNSVSVDGEGSAGAATLGLEATVPNPFRDHATVRYTVPEAGAVSLRVYDALGREVARLAEGEKGAGRHEVTFMPRGLSAGMYLVHLRTAQGVRTQRLTLSR